MNIRKQRNNVAIRFSSSKIYKSASNNICKSWAPYARLFSNPRWLLTLLSDEWIKESFNIGSVIDVSIAFIYNIFDDLAYDWANLFITPLYYNNMLKNLMLQNSHIILWSHFFSKQKTWWDRS